MDSSIGCRDIGKRIGSVLVVLGDGNFRWHTTPMSRRSPTKLGIWRNA